MKRLLLLAAGGIACLAGCCPSVKVIEPVATQNQRNAVALRQNLSMFLAESDVFLNGYVEVAVAEHYAQVIRALNTELKAVFATTRPATQLQASADRLKAQLDGMSPEAREIQKDRYRLEQPLAAAIAFDGMEPGRALALAEAFRQIRGLQDLPPPEKYRLYRQLVRDLPVLLRLDRAREDLLQAHAEQKATLLQQALIAEEAAVQLLQASRNSDGAAASKRVGENPQAIEQIAALLERNTHDEDRRTAARNLLERLKAAPPVSAGIE